MTSQDKYRWYQTETKVVVEVPIKNLTDEDVSVNYAPDCLTLDAKLPSDEIFLLKLNLYDLIVPDQCSCRVRPSKIEISLMKEIHSMWRKLEKEQECKPNVPVQTKNWDKFIKDALSADKDEEKSVDELFASIYGDGNDDQKRAMLKSFTESGGTVLSTDWDEVRKQKVEIKPPEGVEFKPW